MASRWRVVGRRVGFGLSLSVASCAGCPDSPGEVTTPTPNPCQVTAVIVNGVPPQMVRGQSAQLTHSVTQSGQCDAAELQPTWSSSSPSRVSLTPTSTGATITALAPVVAPDFVSITVGVHGQSGSSLLTVSPGPATTGVISPSNPVLAVSTSRQLTLELRDGGGFVTPANASLISWSVPQQAFVTVSSTGLLTALGSAGSTVVTASYAGSTPTVVATSGITVTLAPAASLTVSPATKDVGVGGTTTLTAIIKDAQGNTLTGRAVTWQSLSPAIATVGVTTGVVTGVSVGGPVVIRARADENQAVTGDASVSVSACPNSLVLAEPFNTDPGSTWTTSIVTANPVNQFHNQTVAFQGTGGNGGGYRRMAHNMIGTGTMWVYHRREAEYDPSLPGNAIASLNYSEDQIMFDTPSAVGWGFFLEQGGNRYTKSIGTAVFTNGTWASGSIPIMTAADFPGVNFTASGGKIKFGFYRANTSTSGVYTVTHGIDNWRLEVCRQ